LNRIIERCQFASSWAKKKSIKNCKKFKKNVPYPLHADVGFLARGGDRGLPFPRGLVGLGAELRRKRFHLARMRRLGTLQRSAAGTYTTATTTRKKRKKSVKKV
jgi:hypothetical protein